MKLFTIVLALSQLLAVTAPTNAPLDRYFGQQKMSALRIRYEIMQLRPRYETHKLLPEDTEHLLDLDAQSFYAWAQAYPNDTWLASTGFLLAGLYAELPGTTARAAAVKAYTFVKSRFPKTTYAAKSATALHHGVSVKPDPWWAPAIRAAHSASPSPSPAIAPSAGATSTPTPAPSAAPT